MENAPILSFRPKQASVHLGVTPEGRDTRAIVLVTMLESGEDVQTSDKRSLRSVEWVIRFLDTDHYNEYTTKEGAIGMLFYFPESTSEYNFSPESCNASAALDKSTFDSLYAALVAGRMPDWISMSIKGMTYGYDPEGSEKNWNTNDHAALPITKVSMRIPLVASTTKENVSIEIEQETTLTLPATSADTRAVGEIISTAVNQMQLQIVRQLKWIVAITFVASLTALVR